MTSFFLHSPLTLSLEQPTNQPTFSSMAETLTTSPPPTQHQNPEPVLPPDPKPPTSAQLPPHTSATTTSDSSTKAAPFEPSPTRPLQVSIPVVSSSGLAAGSDGGKEREPERPTFSQLLAGAMASGNSPRSPQMVALPMVAMPCFVSPAGLLESPRFTGQFGMSHQAVLASVTAQAQMQLRTGDLSPSPSPTLPPISSSSTVSQLQKPIRSEEKVIAPQAEPLHVSEQKPQSNYSVAKTTSGDGYNWRKYGQKQVKASENSRSYYRCTHANCSAKKKVEHCQDGRVNDITYRGVHSHEPPQKVKCSKERGPHGPLKDDGNLELPGGELKHLDRCPSKNNQDSGNETSEQLHCSSDCEVDPNTNTERDLGEGPDPKRRLCEVPVAYVPSLFKSAREAKVVVQSSCNEGPASDGYRWRKYGQKIVKGSPNPRSYYKCTHTGCPVRKHVERAEDAKTIITTYEGHHNHDIPPLRSSSDSPASMTSNEQMQASNSVDKTPSECITVNNEEATCDGAAEPQEMPLESAKSLSGIGLDSNSKDKSGGNSSDIIQRRLFDGNPAVIPVKNS